MNEMQSICDETLASVKKDFESQPLPPEGSYHNPVTKDNFHNAEMILLNSNKDWMYCLQTEAYAQNSVHSRLKTILDDEIRKVEADHNILMKDVRLNDPFNISVELLGIKDDEISPSQDIRNIEDAITAYERFGEDLDKIGHEQRNKVKKAFNSQGIIEGLIGLTQIDHVVKNPAFERVVLYILGSDGAYIAVYNFNSKTGAFNHIMDAKAMKKIADTRGYLTEMIKQTILPIADGYLLTNPSNLVDGKAQLSYFERTIQPELKKTYDNRTWTVRLKNDIAKLIRKHIKS